MKGLLWIPEVSCVLTNKKIIYFLRKVYLILGHHYEHIGLMVALQKMDLLAKGDYFVIGVDIEQYEATNPDKYLRGLLQDKTDPIVVEAYQSYLAVIPTSPVLFDDFAKQVRLILGLLFFFFIVYDFMMYM